MVHVLRVRFGIYQFIGKPHFRQSRIAKNRRKRGVRRVPSLPDPDKARLGRKSSRIRNNPTAAEKRLKMSMKIRRIESVRISAHKPRRDSERATKSDSQMGEVAAHPCSLCGRIKSGRTRVGRALQIFDVFMDPIADSS